MEYKAMKRVKEHYNYLLEYVKEDYVFGVFLVGSQNYGLATPDSDVDTKAVVLPTLADLALNAQAVSTTLYVPCGDREEEHMTVTDFRLWMAQLRKGNVNTLETLFTEYFVVNPKYQAVWEELQVYREDFARMDASMVFSASLGVFNSKKKHCFNVTDKTKETFDKYGYDPKSLMHMLRMYSFMVRYFSTEPFESCLKARDRGYLLLVKNGNYSLEEAQALVDKYEEALKKLKDWWVENFSAYYVSDHKDKLVKRMDRLCENALKEALRGDFK